MKRHLSTFDKAKLVFVACGLMFGGGLCLWGPPEAVEGVPHHELLGTAFLVLGLLFFLAAFNVRARAALVGLVAGGIAAMMLISAVTGGYPAWQSALLGIVGLLVGVFSVMSLSGIASGRDPATSERLDS